MGLSDIGGIADALKLGNRIVTVMERLTTDTNVKAEFEQHGKVTGSFSLGDYSIDFTVKDKKKTAIPAEITEVTE